MPPKNYTMSHKKMDNLKGKKGNILADSFMGLATTMNSDNSDDTKSNSEKLCEVFGSLFSSPHVLPPRISMPIISR